MSLVLFGGVWWLNREVGRAVSDHYEGRRITTHLHAVREAQEAFLKSSQGFWRSDIARLPGLSATLAAADDRPIAGTSAAQASMPVDGYWLRTLRFADEAGPDSRRFGALARPSNAAAGRFMYVIREKGIAWRKPAVAGGIDLFPADLAGDGWEPAP